MLSRPHSRISTLLCTVPNNCDQIKLPHLQSMRGAQTVKKPTT